MRKEKKEIDKLIVDYFLSDDSEHQLDNHEYNFLMERCDNGELEQETFDDTWVAKVILDCISITRPKTACFLQALNKHCSNTIR